MAGGSYHEYKDIVEVNMMKPGAISLPLTIVISPVWEILKNEEMSLFAISYLVIDIEAETAEGPETTFKSEAPMLKGSLENIAYSIKSIEPSTDKIKIDPTTGVLSVDKHHGFEIGQEYVISVKVANKYATDGVSFNNVYTLKVVNRIVPVANFSYPVNVEIYESSPLKVTPDEGLEGDGITFTLKDDLNKQLSIDKNGVVSAKKGHTIPNGDYTITVTASNTKNSKEASFNLKVKNNPNKFSFIRYGNNIGVDAISNANQFRITVDKAADAATILSKFTIEVLPVRIQNLCLHQQWL